MTLRQMDVEEKPKTIHRVINLRTGEVRCPYHGRHVNVIGTCIDACQFYERIGKLTRVDCIWSAADGKSGEVNSELC